mmetsp:Transcript_28752/g.54295  ORF Transcript_28752/g.54295 Transcript_28752/m.54295 type:complete len:340 (+) Transcript_28752:66-1085(+)
MPQAGLLCCKPAPDTVPSRREEARLCLNDIEANKDNLQKLRELCIQHNLPPPDKAQNGWNRAHKPTCISALNDHLREHKLPALFMYPKHKVKFYSHVPGADHNEDLKKNLANLLRDNRTKNCKPDLTLRDGAHDYYLRSTQTKRNSCLQQMQDAVSDADALLEVDHTLECQLLAHILTQTKAVHPVIKTIVSPNSKEQTEVVKNLMSALKPLHNSMHDQDFFNLRVVSRNTNMKKKQVVQGFVQGEYDFAEHRDVSQVSLGDKFVELLTNDTGPLKEDHDAACRTSGVLLRELDKNHDDWVTRLGQIGGASAQMKRYNALGETVQTVYERLEYLWLGGT